jgi:hypothetical protein
VSNRNRPHAADAAAGRQTLTRREIEVKRLALTLIAGVLLSAALGGCIVVPEGGGHYHHHGYYD